MRAKSRSLKKEEIFLPSSFPLLCCRDQIEVGVEKRLFCVFFFLPFLLPFPFPSSPTSASWRRQSRRNCSARRDQAMASICCAVASRFLSLFFLPFIAPPLWEAVSARACATLGGCTRGIVVGIANRAAISSSSLSPFFPLSTLLRDLDAGL